MLNQTKLKEQLYQALENGRPTVTIETLELEQLLNEYEKSEDIAVNTYGEWFSVSLGIFLGSVMTGGTIILLKFIMR